MKKELFKKNKIFYIILLMAWTLLLGFLWYSFITGFINLKFLEGAVDNQTVRILSLIVLILNAIFISYFWLNGIKDFIYVVWYYLAKRSLNKKFDKVLDADISNMTGRVLLLYCTCNDFDGNSLEKSMRQDYGNFETFILDDSSSDEYKKQVDQFAKSHHIKVIRRENRQGFKAGNINHFLMNETLRGGNYDYAVILDSDEILPNNFIKECFKYFATYENIGIVQGNHVSTRNRNLFMKMFHLGVNSHWPTYQSMKNFYGFSTMLGHGAMIKKEAYEIAGGFPKLVAEDLCLSIEMREHGYYVAFAPDIICEEEYPVDFLAFKKRHSKWTQGNMEFIKNYTGRILKSKMKWYEKADIFLFTYNLPLTAVFSFYLVLNLIFVPLLQVDLSNIYTIWMMIPTIVFFLSPMLNDFITWIFKINFFRFIAYCFLVFVLYGSMFAISLLSSFMGLFGKKAVFVVTPKKSSKMSLGLALKSQIPEIIFSSVLLAVSLVFSKSFLPVILMVVTGYFSIFLLFMSDKKYSPIEVAKIDKETTEISLRSNGVFQYEYKKRITAENVK